MLASGGLYAITPEGISTDPAAVARVAAVLAGGAGLLQLRDPAATRDQRRQLARQLLPVCAEYRVPLVINDDLALAQELSGLGQVGLHLGAEDAPLAKARAALGQEALIGASCYADLARAENAVAAGASYLAFGALYPSSTKPGAVHCTLELLCEARRRFALPLVAIGGITVENGGPVIGAGADWLAVIDGLFAGDAGPEQLQRRSRALCQLFEPST